MESNIKRPFAETWDSLHKKKYKLTGIHLFQIQTDVFLTSELRTNLASPQQFPPGAYIHAPLPQLFHLTSEDGMTVSWHWSQSKKKQRRPIFFCFFITLTNPDVPASHTSTLVRCPYRTVQRIYRCCLQSLANEKPQACPPPYCRPSDVKCTQACTPHAAALKTHSTAPLLRPSCPIMVRNWCLSHVTVASSGHVQWKTWVISC